MWPPMRPRPMNPKSVVLTIRSQSASKSRDYATAVAAAPKRACVSKPALGGANQQKEQ